MQLIDNPNDPSKKVIRVSYPLDADVNDLYSPAKSNSEWYKNATKGLYQKLKNKKLLELFHEQFCKSMREGHMEMLMPEDYYLNLYYLKIGENIDIYELHVIISILYYDC